MVDLHGLYVDEALEYAEQEFQLARKDKVVRFIVGTPSLCRLLLLRSGLDTDLGKGLHARDGKAKIRPALEKLCREYVGIVVGHIHHSEYLFWFILGAT